MEFLVYTKKEREFELYINLKALNNTWYKFLCGLLLRIINRKSIYFFYNHVFRGKNLLTDFLLKKSHNITLC